MDDGSAGVSYCPPSGSLQELACPNPQRPADLTEAWDIHRFDFRSDIRPSFNADPLSVRSNSLFERREQAQRCNCYDGEY